MTPQKYPQNLHTPKKIFIFLKTQKYWNSEFWPPPPPKKKKKKKIARAYVCAKLSENPPPPLPLGLYSLYSNSQMWQREIRFSGWLNQLSNLTILKCRVSSSLQTTKFAKRNAEGRKTTPTARFEPASSRTPKFELQKLHWHVDWCRRLIREVFT